MALLTCGDCTAAYSVGAAACPHCGSTTRREDSAPEPATPVPGELAAGELAGGDRASSEPEA